MLLASGVTCETGGMALSGQGPIRAALTGEACKSPTCSAAVALTVLHHNVDALPPPFQGDAFDLFGFQELVNQHRSVWKPTGAVSLFSLLARIDMMDSPFCCEPFALGTNHRALHVRPSAICGGVFDAATRSGRRLERKTHNNGSRNAQGRYTPPPRPSCVISLRIIQHGNPLLDLGVSAAGRRPGLAGGRRPALRGDDNFMRP